MSNPAQRVHTILTRSTGKELQGKPMLAGWRAVERARNVRRMGCRTILFLLTPGVVAARIKRRSVVELTYRLALLKREILFQPDLQYIIRPSGTGQIPDALVLGAEVGVNF